MTKRFLRLKRERFKQLVAESIDELPEEFRKKMENVNIVVEARPSDEILEQQGIRRTDTLLGLYHGIPLKNRGVSYTNVLPDKIIIYQKSIERLCDNKDEIKEEVRAVFMHELGHHFGMSEKDLFDN